MAESPVACDCCGKTTQIYYEGPFYAVEDIDCLCPECISSGKAAQRYNGEFQGECSLEGGVDSPDKLDELIHRTVGSRSIGGHTVGITAPLWDMWDTAN